MQYKIEPIGASFSDKAIIDLANHFTTQSQSGYKLHSVFQAESKGCLGFGSPEITYFAIYVKE